MAVVASCRPAAHTAGKLFCARIKLDSCAGASRAASRTHTLAGGQAFAAVSARSILPLRPAISALLKPAGPTAVTSSSKAQTPRRPLAPPAANGAGFQAAPTNAPCAEEDVCPKYRGLSPLAVEQAFRAQHPGLLEALAASTASLTPATAAQLLRHLEAELPPLPTELAPGGDCVLVAIAPGLLPLLESATACCEASLRVGPAHRGVEIARATLSLLSCLRFGGGASAAGYAAVGVRCKQALQAAFGTGANISEEDIVDLYASCARASSWLWLTPYFGNACACAVDDRITAGWSSAELAVRFVEACAALTRRGRKMQAERKFVRLVQAALQHSLSLGQVRRVLAATKSLPVEMSIQLALNARSEPSNNWYDQLLHLQQDLEHQQQRRSLQRAVARHAAVAAREATATATPATRGKAVPARRLQRA